MPLYNKRAYVRRAIESIQKQTFCNWELIIIDDGSIDGSSEEIPKSDKRIRLYHPNNSGPSAARNKGIREAKGHFVTFLDADDFLLSSAAESILPEALRENMLHQVLHRLVLIFY